MDSNTSVVTEPTRWVSLSFAFSAEFLPTSRERLTKLTCSLPKYGHIMPTPEG